MPYSNRDWEAQEVATLRVMLQYISDKMYNDIRGPGLTYSVSLSGSVTEGRLSLKFYRYMKQINSGTLTAMTL